MTDVVVKRGGHYLLLVAAGLGAVSATALAASVPSIAADPESGPFAAGSNMFVAAIDVFLAGLLGWAAFRADRGGVIRVSAAAIVLALSVGLEVLDEAFSTHPAFAGAHTIALLSFISVAANALVVLFAALELILGRQRRGTSASKPGAA